MRKSSPHSQRQRPLSFLIASMASLLGLVTLIFFIPPSLHLSLIVMDIPILFLFFPLLIVFLYCIPRYFLVSKKHGLLLAIFGLLYSIMLLMELRHPFFLIILLALFFTLELLFTGKTQ